MKIYRRPKRQVSERRHSPIGNTRANEKTLIMMIAQKTERKLWLYTEKNVVFPLKVSLFKYSREQIYFRFALGKGRRERNKCSEEHTCENDSTFLRIVSIVPS